MDLCVIFNKTVNNAVYPPEILTVQKLIPIPKEAKYRPIAVLFSIDKIFEKILCDKLLSYMEEKTSRRIFNLDLDEGVVLRM